MLKECINLYIFFYNKNIPMAIQWENVINITIGGNLFLIVKMQKHKCSKTRLSLNKIDFLLILGWNKTWTWSWQFHPDTAGFTQTLQKEKKHINLKPGLRSRAFRLLAAKHH